MTDRSLSTLEFLQIYRNKRAQQWKFYAYIFSEQLFGENICLKFSLLCSFLVINLKKPQSRKWWSSCQSFKKFTLILVFRNYDSFTTLLWRFEISNSFTQKSLAKGLFKDHITTMSQLSLQIHPSVIYQTCVFFLLNFVSATSTNKFVKKY